MSAKSSNEKLRDNIQCIEQLNSTINVFMSYIKTIRSEKNKEKRLLKIYLLSKQNLAIADMR